MSSDEQNFRLEVLTTSFPDRNRVNMCLKCVGPLCEDVIEILEKEINFYDEDELNEKICLVQIGLEVYKNLQSDSVYGVQYKAYLSDFYNNVTKYGKGLSYLSRKLKGGAAALFCVLMRLSLRAGLLNENDIIVLDASGELDDKDMYRLIDYYVSLGFQESFPDMINIFMDDLNVPMKGRVIDIINSCNNRQISPELQELIDRL